MSPGRDRDCERNAARPKQSRNESFNENDHEPFNDEPSLSLIGATGAFKFLGPTSAMYSWSGWKDAQEYHPSSEDTATGSDGATERSPLLSSNQRERQKEDGNENDVEDGEPKGEIPASKKNDTLGFVWRSRDNRKGRHALVLRRDEDGKKQPHGTLEPTNTLPATMRGIYLMFTEYPYWDVSWCVAVVYTVGSIIWVANGFSSLLPWLVHYSSSQEEKLQTAQTWTAFAGALMLLLGSYLLFLESINANRGGCFGWAVERTIKGGRMQAEVHPGDCRHEHHEQPKDERQGDDDDDDDTHSGNFRGEEENHESPEQMLDAHNSVWQWWPSYRDLRTHYLYQIGFLACAIQLISSCFFFLTKFTTLPGITEHIPQPVLDATNWAPQVLGCTGFIIASWLFMLETQPRWYVPAPCILGWHVGFWKLAGSTGFLLSTLFGPVGQHGVAFAARQSSVMGFWGSWAMVVGSLAQWYEALNKHPVVQEGRHGWSEWNGRYVGEKGGAS